MAQFVLVANGASNVDFEKAMEVKIKSAGKVKFVPQAVGQGATGGHNVVTGSMNSANEILSSVRFEWDQSGHQFGAEIVNALAGHHPHDGEPPMESHTIPAPALPVV